MKKGIHNFSEIGKLEKVLLHRINTEIEGLVPDNMHRLLFDDIPYLKVAQEEHDNFAEVLRSRGTEVIYYEDETAKAISDPEVKNEFVRRVVAESQINSNAVAEAITEYLLGFEERALVDKVIAGVKKEDVPEVKSDSLADYVQGNNPFYMEPMPNLYFTRDPGACIGNGLSLHHMTTAARRRETILLEFMHKYNRDFALEGTPLWYEYDFADTIEGGDVLVLNDKTVAVGLSARTNARAIELFAKRILTGSDFERVLVFDIPKRRAFMHLDTVFTMVDYDKFTIHPEIEGPLQLFELTLDSKSNIIYKVATDSLENLLKSVLKVPAVKLIRCGGDDKMAAQREQWNDGSNTLCIAPGTVVTYERNNVTNDLLDKEGIEVLAIPSAELSRGRGGPRCMSCPVVREDL